MYDEPNRVIVREIHLTGPVVRFEHGHGGRRRDPGALRRTWRGGQTGPPCHSLGSPGTLVERRSWIEPEFQPEFQPKFHVRQHRCGGERGNRRHGRRHSRMAANLMAVPRGGRGCCSCSCRWGQIPFYLFTNFSRSKINMFLGSSFNC